MMGTLNGMAKRVLEIIRDEKLMLELSKNARSFAEKFTWDKAAEEFRGVIEGML